MSDDFDSSGSGDESGCSWVILLGGGVVCLISSAVAGVTDIRYKLGGKSGEAVVTEGAASDSESGGRYEFKIGDKVYWGNSQQAQLGQAVAIEYLPSNPQSNRLNGSSNWIPTGLILLLIAVPMLIGGVVLFRNNDDFTKD